MNATATSPPQKEQEYNFLGSVWKDNKRGIAETAAAFAVPEALDRFLSKDNKIGRTVGYAAAGAMPAGKSLLSAWQEGKGGNLSDAVMHGITGVLGTYGIATQNKEAIGTSAFLKLLFDISHEAQEGIDERFIKIRKELATKFPGLALLAHAEAYKEAVGGEGHNHAEGDDHSGHEHPAKYKDNEAIDADTGLTLTADEQERLEEILDHYPIFSSARTKEGFDTFQELHQKNTNGTLTAHEVAEFERKYRFLIMAKDGEAMEFDAHKKEFTGVFGKDAPKSSEDASITTLPNYALLKGCESYDQFKEQFKCLYFDVRRASTKEEIIVNKEKSASRKVKVPDMDGDKYKYESEEYESIWCREIQKGDLVKVKAGQGFPVDGDVLYVSEKAKINTLAYSGDENDQSAAIGDKVFQMGNVTSGEITLLCTSKYKESSAYKMINALTSEKGIPAQLKLKKIIDNYIGLMLGAGSLLFLKDAVKNAQKGYYLDTKTLLSKKNIENALNFFVAAAPCPLAASMLAYKGIEEKLKSLQNGNETVVRSREQLVNAKDTNVVILDLTGTLTENAVINPQSDIDMASKDEAMLIAVAKKLEFGKTHPVAAAIRHMKHDAADNVTLGEMSDNGIHEDIKKLGNGVAKTIDGKKSYIGGIEFFRTLKDKELINEELFGQIEDHVGKMIQTESDAVNMRDAVVVMHEGKKGTQEWGVIGYTEELRSQSKATLQALMKSGKEVVIATGSSHEKGRMLLNKMGIEFVENEKDDATGKVRLFATLKPGSELDDSTLETKTGIVEHYFKQGKKVMMVGDGVNDAQAFMKVSKTRDAKNNLLGVAVGMQGANTGLVEASAGIMIRNINQVHGLIKLSEKLDKTINWNVGLSGAWMGFLVTLHLLGDKLKEWFGFSISPIVNAVFHEGMTVAIALKGGHLDPERLAKHYTNESQKILQSAQISLN